MSYSVRLGSGNLFRVSESFSTRFEGVQDHLPSAVPEHIARTKMPPKQAPEGPQFAECRRIPRESENIMSVSRLWAQIRTLLARRKKRFLRVENGSSKGRCALLDPTQRSSWWEERVTVAVSGSMRRHLSFRATPFQG